MASAPTAGVSYVVLCRNSARYIERCVRSLLRQPSAVNARDEAIVVDNGSTDDSSAILERLAAEFPTLTVIRLPRNGGTTVPRNMALKRAKGAFVAIIDSDVDMPAGTIAALRARLDADPSCGIVAPRLVFPDGRPQLSTDVFPTLQHKVRRYLFLRRIERHMAASADTPHAVDYAISAVWLMRRDLLDAVGLFDERIFYSPEDVDFCLRVWKAGYRVMLDPGVHAIHDAQEISRTWLPRRATFSHAAGLAYLFAKHGYLWTRRPLYRRISEAAARRGSPAREVPA